MERRVNRIEPLMPASAYKTYRAAAPLTTHWETVSCETAGCSAFLNGWITVIHEREPPVGRNVLSAFIQTLASAYKTYRGLSDVDQRRAYYIRNMSGREYVERRDESGATVFEFAAGQTCFESKSHKLRTDRPEILVVHGGDWRGNPRRESMTHTRPEDWVDDMAETLDALDAEHAKG
jgi:hypothetical protein